MAIDGVLILLPVPLSGKMRNVYVVGTRSMACKNGHSVYCTRLEARLHLFEPAVLQSCAEESYCKQSSTMFGGAEAEAAHMFFKHASPVSFYQSDRSISQLHRPIHFFRQGQKHLLARSGMSEVS
jgi:hypothetical protein